MFRKITKIRIFALAFLYTMAVCLPSLQYTMVYAEEPDLNHSPVTDIERFNDVPAGHWADRDIHLLRALNITGGIGNNQFGLEKDITRAEFVAFLVKLMQWEQIRPEKGSFVDNQNTAEWYYPFIETAVSYGAVHMDFPNFRPNEPITREDMAIMLVRTLGYDRLAKQLVYLESPFSDVSNNTGYITIAKDFGIIGGVGNNRFSPDSKAKREQAAAMMMRMYAALNSKITELHGFYAIQSFPQRDLMASMNSVSFGWCRLEYNAGTGQVFLNTSRNNSNEYAIPDGFSQQVAYAQTHQTSTQLMIALKDDPVIFAKNQESETSLPLGEYILFQPEIRSQVIQMITDQVVSTTAMDSTVSFDGVVIDFENYRGEDSKLAFNQFLQALSVELKKNNKTLSVAVPPARRPGFAHYDGYDFKTIGQIADKIILMAHDYYAKQLTDVDKQIGFTETPLTPLEEVYYALKVITDSHKGVADKSKILLQLSFDTVQWKLKDKQITHTYPIHPSYDLLKTRLLTDIELNYSNLYQNPYIQYYNTDDETQNVIWYEDARSVQAKITLAKMFGVNGISLWRLGTIPDYQELDDKKVFLNVWEEILKNRTP